MKTLVSFFSASGITGADIQFHEQYPDINWKEGKLLNGASKEEIKAWVASNAE